ncbi:MAG: SDR family NAD(P)-dependent oxidoreductase [Myxococcota bacterium]
MTDSVLITGGNSGIGLECARELAREGWHVWIASRNRAASEAAARHMHGKAEVLEVDLGSLDSVRALVREIEARNVPLRALVCNAGLQFNQGPRLSPEGFELTFAANHLGHFLLANLLLERLAANSPARIVVVSSGVHDPARRTGMPVPAIGDLDTLAKTGGPKLGEFNGQRAYSNSKLCNLWFAYELSRRVDPNRVTVNAWEPGLVGGSGLARDYTPALRFLWNYVLPPLSAVISPFYPSISTLKKSGEALARMVMDPVLADTTGCYFPSHTHWEEARSSDESYDVERARALWDASARMSGLGGGVA